MDPMPHSPPGEPAPPTPSPTSAPRALDEPALPQRVQAALDEPVAELWRRRLAQHRGDWYAGLRLQKFPEDLRAYEHVMWASDPEVVIELGSHRGGSSLWFRDRLAALGRYRPATRRLVVAVSHDTGAAREGVALRDPRWAEDIVFVDGDVRDPELPGRVGRHLRPGTRCLVVEDTAHRYDTTRAALDGFSRFVQPGGFFVVEDGVVDVAELTGPGPSGGVLRAVQDWLGSASGQHFHVRPEMELYGLTSSPGGWLQRRPA